MDSPHIPLVCTSVGKATFDRLLSECTNGIHPHDGVKMAVIITTQKIFNAGRSSALWCKKRWRSFNLALRRDLILYACTVVLVCATVSVGFSPATIFDLLGGSRHQHRQHRSIASQC